MAKGFNWDRPGYKLDKLNFEWNVQMPFLETRQETNMCSPFFSSKESADRKWQLELWAERKTFVILAFNHDAEGEITIDDPVVLKISILNVKRRKIFQKMKTSEPESDSIEIFFSNDDIIKSQCQQADGSYTFSCKIFSHVKKELVSSAGLPGLAMDCSGGLITHLEGLYDGMKFSDVSFNISDREFPAHKNILAARSEVFAAMFKHPTKENLTNQITIEDVDPEVFKELLRFIYTGRVPLDKMETMAAGLLIAADKYLLDELKKECGKYLVHQMSPANCAEILLHGDLLNPAEHLKEAVEEAAKFFRRLPSEVMATAKWEKIEKENPQLLFKIQKILFSKK